MEYSHIVPAGRGSNMSLEILKLNHITKAFPGVVALNDISVGFSEGEVHAIVGENGAGKSTLIKILTGAYRPTSGSLEVFGNTYSCLSPHQALKIGIVAIYQEFNLIPYLTVSENIFYGREVMKGPFIDKAHMNMETAILCKEMGIELDPKIQVKDLGVAYQQIIEIIKAVSCKAKILIMDEPTAPLTKREIDAMFDLVKKLKNRGVTIIYISHRMEELYEICDTVTIMRDGQYIKSERIDKISMNEIITSMVGREIGETFLGGAGAQEETVLDVVSLTNDKIKNISFQLKKGEILGFGGLVGAGRTETVRALFGADRISSGKISIKGKDVVIRSPKHAIKLGLGLIPEDRKQHGLILSMQIRENISIGILNRISTLSFVRTRQENEICTKLKGELKIKTPTLKQQVRNLSGGNQQKVVLAKWLATKCDILFFDEPTRGIDVGAKQEIYGLMNEVTRQGKSIIMISSEMPELLGMADRLIIMHEGKITGELKKSEYSQQRVLELASAIQGGVK